MQTISHSKLIELYESSTREDSREITVQEYEYALNRIEELLPLVTDETPANHKDAVELTIVSDIVEAYEKSCYPIPKPTIEELTRYGGYAI